MPIDAATFANRLRALLPKGWFSDSAPILNAVLASLAEPWAWLSESLSYVASQTRLATATDEWLTLIATDFLGPSFKRLPNESDDIFRIRIKLNIPRDAATRQSLVNGVQRLTGSTIMVFEPANCLDTGAYGSINTAHANAAYGFVYGASGGWGNLSLPYEVFVTAITEPRPGEPAPIGYGVSGGGYSAGSLAYNSLSNVPGVVTDEDIRQVVKKLLPVNCTAWLRFV